MKLFHYISLLSLKAAKDLDFNYCFGYIPEWSELYLRSEDVKLKRIAATQPNPLERKIIE